eukprot:scaffold534227_cov34-Prasinocladus_malaysianus.AAC.1
MNLKLQENKQSPFYSREAVPAGASKLPYLLSLTRAYQQPHNVIDRVTAWPTCGHQNQYQLRDL